MPAPFQKNKSNRGVAQVVAHQTGGLGVASSSLVTPTKKKLRNSEALFLSNPKDWYVITLQRVYHRRRRISSAEGCITCGLMRCNTAC